MNALLAALAIGGLWVWTDASGADHYTDDPSVVPKEERASLRPLDADDASLSVVDPDGDGDVEQTAADQQRLRVQEADQRRRAVLQGEIDGLERRVAEAEREVRKYEAGGRIGAADAAARARAEAARLKAELAQRRTELVRLSTPPP